MFFDALAFLCDIKTAYLPDFPVRLYAVFNIEKIQSENPFARWVCCQIQMGPKSSTVFYQQQFS